MVTGLLQTSTASPNYDQVCNEFPAVIDGTLGLYNGPPVFLQLNPTIRPICLKARRVPFALKLQMNKEIDCLIEQGVLELVLHGAWEMPRVSHIKPNGLVHICVDYKCTLNKALQDHVYLVPIVSHVLSMLAGAKIIWEPGPGAGLPRAASRRGHPWRSNYCHALGCFSAQVATQGKSCPQDFPKLNTLS